MIILHCGQPIPDVFVYCNLDAAHDGKHGADKTRTVYGGNGVVSRPVEKFDYEGARDNFIEFVKTASFGVGGGDATMAAEIIINRVNRRRHEEAMRRRRR